MSLSRQSTISDRMGLVSMGSGAGIRGVQGGAGVVTLWKWSKGEKLYCCALLLYPLHHPANLLSSDEGYVTLGDMMRQLSLDLPPSQVLYYIYIVL